MKLSGHNFSNSTFDSLLDGLCKDVELKKNAETVETPKINEFFSSATAEVLDDIHRDELDFIANELTFAAEKARIAVSVEDLVKFAHQVDKAQIKGKALERAAQKFCNHLDREFAPPQGTTKLSAGDLIDQLSNHKVIPAGYNPEHGSNDSVTGKFMGSSKNPNTIWDTDALQTYAQQKNDKTFGDEEIKTSKLAAVNYKTSINDNKLTESQIKEQNEVLKMNSKVANANTTPENVETFNSNLPDNAMSMFSNNRDFENIPEQTAGEKILVDAAERANKKIASKDEDRDIQRPQNTKDALNNLFE